MLLLQAQYIRNGDDCVYFCDDLARSKLQRQLGGFIEVNCITLRQTQNQEIIIIWGFKMPVTSTNLIIVSLF